MAAPKLAPIQIFSGKKELGRIEPAQIMHILMIEDDNNVRESTVRKLEESGYRVDAFPTPREAAQALRPHEYQLVIVDIRFDAPNISGDEFILKNKDILEDAKIVAFTGHEDDIVHGEVFNEIILKGKLKNALHEYAESVYHERQEILARRIQIEITESPKGESEGISDNPKDELVRILNETKDMDKKILWYKGRDFSANELLLEVEDDASSVGKSHIRMVMDWLAKKKRD